MADSMSKHTIETYSGIFLDTLYPDVNDILFADITWALARQNRFAGHSITARPYSVGQHSIVVAKIGELLLFPDLAKTKKQHQLAIQSFKFWYTNEDVIELMMLNSEQRNRIFIECFMHDFAEAYLVDVPTPIKRIPGVGEVYNKLETHMHHTILHAFGLNPISDSDIGQKIVRWADLLALAYEASTMVRSRGKKWRLLPSMTIKNPVPTVKTEGRVRKEFDEYWRNRVQPLIQFL